MGADDRESHRESHDHANRSGERERRCRMPRDELTGYRRGNRDPVCHECGGIVEQAFPFQYGLDRAGETEIYAPIRVLEDRETQKALVAQPAVRGGNLLIIEPPGPLAMPEAAGGGLPVAPDLLAYAELRYRGTGQALEAAELLLPKVLDNATH